VDGETIQITSRDALDGIQRLEFYLLPDSLRNQFASGDALLESLAMEMRDRDGAGEPTSLTMDELSGRLIVLGPPTWHRNLDERLRAKAE
jgi:hypothetical protein